MSRKKFFISAIFLLSMTFIFSGKAFYAYADEKDSTICKNVFIDDVDVSGMTKEEAIAAVDNFVDGLRSKEVTIAVGDKKVQITMGELGYTYVSDDSIEQAFNLGKSGNLIKRYKDLKDIEYGSVVYPLKFTFDENKLKNVIKVDASSYNIAPVNASLSRKNGRFVYKDAVVGSKVDVDKTLELVKNEINNWKRDDITVNAAMTEDKPQYTMADVEKCNAILGSFTTEYADSAQGRASNLANGSRLINNTVIYPGEVFSSYQHLSPFTEQNGYYVAGAYLQGKVIDSVGGGACQVTTTLYNAVLNSELQVVERQPHSMIISYVDLSRDAAIAGTYKDFKFMNSTDTPILIQSFTEGRRITFNIWGQETRDTKNRKIKYLTKVISKTNPPKDVITKDPTMPTSYYKVTQSAHTGYRAELYKIVYENGVEVSRTLVNKSSYAAAPRYITIGTKVDKEKKDDTEKDGKTDNKTTDTPDTQKNDSKTTDGSGKANNQTDTKPDSGSQKKPDSTDQQIDLE